LVGLLHSAVFGVFGVGGGAEVTVDAAKFETGRPAGCGQAKVIHIVEAGEAVLAVERGDDVG
jgi:hypothetical protein